MGERAMRPFWLHQAAEYLIGIAVVATAIQDPKPVVPSIVGVLVILNAAIVRGPLGAFKWFGRRVHRWIDLFLMIVILLVVFQPFAESGEHFVGGFAGRANDEDEAKLLLVSLV